MGWRWWCGWWLQWWAVGSEQWWWRAIAAIQRSELRRLAQSHMAAAAAAVAVAAAAVVVVVVFVIVVFVIVVVVNLHGPLFGFARVGRILFDR